MKGFWMHFREGAKQAVRDYFMPVTWLVKAAKSLFRRLNRR